MISVIAKYDGSVFKPEKNLEIPKDKLYLIEIEEIEEGKYPLEEIEKLSVDMGVKDLSSNHDFYSSNKLK